MGIISEIPCVLISNKIYWPFHRGIIYVKNVCPGRCLKKKLKMYFIYKKYFGIIFISNTIYFIHDSGIFVKAENIVLYLQVKYFEKRNSIT